MYKDYRFINAGEKVTNSLEKEEYDMSEKDNNEFSNHDAKKKRNPRLKKPQMMQIIDMMQKGETDIDVLMKKSGATRREQIYSIRRNRKIKNEKIHERTAMIRYDIVSDEEKQRGWQLRIAKKYNVSRQYVNAVYLKMQKSKQKK